MESVVIAYRPDAYADLEAEVVSAFEQAQEQSVRVVLNLDELDTLDTNGVRGLITLLRRSRALGGELTLRVSKPAVLRTLEVTALDRLFPLMRVEAA